LLMEELFPGVMMTVSVSKRGSHNVGKSAACLLDTSRPSKCCDQARRCNIYRHHSSEITV
jgi:hypothetical protein